MRQPLKTFCILFDALCSQIIICIADWLVALLYWLSAVYYKVSLEGYEIICARSFSFEKGQQDGRTYYLMSFSFQKDKLVNILSISPKKNICWCRSQELPKNLNIYLYNYQTKIVIFLAAKHAMLLFKFLWIFPWFWTLGQR